MFTRQGRVGGWFKNVHFCQHLYRKKCQPRGYVRVSVQGVKSLGGHFAFLCREFVFMKEKKDHHFSKRKGKYFYTFNHFYCEKSSKRAK